MGILAWTLGPPTAATALAFAWVKWVNRPRGPIEIKDSLAAHARFKAALEKRELAISRKP